MLRTLVFGGYGNFGARIARALAGDPAIALVIAGRDAQRARDFAASLGRGVEGRALDIASPHLATTLRDAGIGLVVHSAGPFQEQGYGVARAAAAAGAHYVDLADGRRFVCDFEAGLDADFRAAGCLGIAGASTVPALSSAVVDHLCAGWREIHAVDMCIAPAQSAPRGLATLAAVLGYCGAPVGVWDEGRWREQPGWSRPMPVRFARLAPRRAALCDIPDLELFPGHYRVRDRVWFGAALELGLAQRVFAGIAAARVAGVVRRPERLASLMHRCGRWLDGFGSRLGGMFVRVRGAGASGEPAARAWHIAAGDDHGPEIPCMAAILLARRIARGGIGRDPGATACVGLLGLHEFEPEFARWGMVTDVVDDGLDERAAR